jgi:hypothetical protein
MNSRSFVVITADEMVVAEKHHQKYRVKDSDSERLLDNVEMDDLGPCNVMMCHGPSLPKENHNED